MSYDYFGIDFVLGGRFFFMGIPRFRLKLFFRLTGAPPLLVSSFPLKVSQQSLRVANQRKSHNLDLGFSIIHKLFGIKTSFPVEDKNFYVVCFLLIFGPMGITWEGGEAKSVAPLSYYGPGPGNTKNGFK